MFLEGSEQATFQICDPAVPEKPPLLHSAYKVPGGAHPPGCWIDTSPALWRRIMQSERRWSRPTRHGISQDEHFCRIQRDKFITYGILNKGNSFIFFILILKHLVYFPQTLIGLWYFLWQCILTLNTPTFSFELPLCLTYLLHIPT